MQLTNIFSSRDSMHKFWNIFATVSTILGFSSLMDNVIRWTGIIRSAIDVYQNIAHPVGNKIAEVLGVSFNSEFFDSYIISFFLTKALVYSFIAIDTLESNSSKIGGLAPSKPITLKKHLVINFIVVPMIATMLVFIWPVVLVAALTRTVYLFFKSRNIDGWETNKLSLSEHMQLVESMKSAANLRKKIKLKCDIECKESLNLLFAENEKKIIELNKIINSIVDDRFSRNEWRLSSCEESLSFYEDMNTAIPFIKTDKEIMNIGRISELKKLIYFLKYVGVIVGILLSLVLANEYINQLT